MPLSRSRYLLFIYSDNQDIHILISNSMDQITRIAELSAVLAGL